MKSQKILFSLFIIIFVIQACNLPGASPTAIATEPPVANATGSISGTVWHDLCAVPDGPVPNPLPAGCVASGSGGLIANGILEAGEPGIAGVTVSLHAASCADPVTATVSTDANGQYNFSNLTDGGYCITIDSITPPNDSVLIPGNWTSPVSTGSLAQISNSIQGGAGLINQNFGWDHQFLPLITSNDNITPVVVPNTSGAPVFIVDTPANCRKGPSTGFSVVTSFPGGTSIPIVGRNIDSSWWVLQADATTTCWTSSVTGHTSGNISNIPIVASPPTPVATGPVFSGPVALYNQLYYPTANCAANIFQVAIHVTDDDLQSVWLSYRFLKSGYTGLWNTLSPNDNASGGLYGFNYDLNAQAAGELGGDDGEIQYQFFAKDSAGNQKSYPDGSVLGIPLQFCP